MKTILVDAFNTFVIKDQGVDIQMHEMLETFPNRKIILTNADDEQMMTLGIVNMPYEVFTLKHQPDKVEPEYFHKFLTKYNLTPDDVIYFEHNADAVKSAESVSIKTYHFDKDERDLEKLKNFLKENL